jgi:hypothetical protein
VARASLGARVRIVGPGFCGSGGPGRLGWKADAGPGQGPVQVGNDLRYPEVAMQLGIDSRKYPFGPVS